MGDPTPEAYEAAARAYCLTRFAYPRNAYVSDDAQQRHINLDARENSRQAWHRAVVEAVWSIAEAQVCGRR